MSESWEKQFPILNEMVFLNHAAVAPLSGPAAKAMSDYALDASKFSYTKGDWYAEASRVKKLAAQLINARSRREIAFIPNTSTGISLVANGLQWVEGDNVVITNVEFPANRYPWHDLKRKGVQVKEVPQQPDGRIDSEDVIDAIDNRTRVVSLSMVQYASGFRMDIARIAEALKPLQRAGRGFLCVDGIQAVGCLPVDVQALGIDFLAADGHKWLLSPEGAGIFYCNEELIDVMHPSIVGWLNMVDALDYGEFRFEFRKDANRFEPGTYNIPGILALGKSIELLLDVGIDTVWENIQRLTTRLVEGLHRKGYHVFTPRGRDETSGIIIFDAPAGSAATNEAIHQQLKEQNIILALREGHLRASPHFYNTDEQIDQLIDALPTA